MRCYVESWLINIASNVGNVIKRIFITVAKWYIGFVLIFFTVPEKET